MLDAVKSDFPLSESSHSRLRAELVASELLGGGLRVEPARKKLNETRDLVQRAWRETSRLLRVQGHPILAADVGRFVERMPAASSEKEQLAAALTTRVPDPFARGPFATR